MSLPLRLSSRRDPPAVPPTKPGIKPESVHLLTEFVLNMSLSSEGDNDVTPLYEQYVNDGRLGEVERQELMWVFMSLQLKVAGVPAGA